MTRLDIAEVLAAVGRGDRGAAAALARTGDGDLARALASHLTAAADGSVYDDPAAFEAFISGGGNVRLYRAVSAVLAGLYDRVRPDRLLDVGTGDGRAVLPALDASSHRPSALAFVEPSAALASTLRRKANDASVHVASAQSYLDSLDATTTFDLVESTFALHAIPPDERDGVLAALARRAGVLAIAEFDVPAFDHGSDAHLRFLAESYARGLAEYDADRDLVAAGFLMPVLTGQLAPGAVRSTWEQPARSWAEQVERAGFTEIELTRLADYWWSPGFLLTARGRPDRVSA
ncbi:class I SAM-dependent methyltransferase [Labedaea rhizosphaerae]|uniref:class I SAM-dependent methyltransferase n=1 Tax=Labedaea rhizosphaerae TaxID=598644 RepID=UPI001061261C|nr:class I SAM-dependent methyltransferase [Labedaea rhizosphaerae]